MKKNLLMLIGTMTLTAMLAFGMGGCGSTSEEPQEETTAETTVAEADYAEYGQKALANATELAGKIAPADVEQMLDHILILDKMIEGPDCIGSAADACDDGVRKPVFSFQHQGFDFSGNHGLKITHDRREGMGTHHRAETVVRVGDPLCPLPHRLAHRIL